MALHALLYDVHGNFPALEAVLADAREAGVERFVLGGDYAVFGAFPGDTVKRLHALDALWIRGNTDRWLVDSSDAPDNSLVQRSLDYCGRALGDRLAAELAELAPTAALEGALFCHASPRSDMLSFAPEASDADTRLLDPADPDVIVFGHTHVQFRREAAARVLVNPGSVGLPFDGDPRSAYALWRGGADFELRRVEYDAAAYARDVRKRLYQPLGEDVEVLVRRIEQAAFVN